MERPSPPPRATVADSRGRIDWRYLRELYVEANLTIDGGITLDELAESIRKVRDREGNAIKPLMKTGA